MRAGDGRCSREREAGRSGYRAGDGGGSRGREAGRSGYRAGDGRGSREREAYRSRHRAPVGYETKWSPANGRRVTQYILIPMVWGTMNERHPTSNHGTRKRRRYAKGAIQEGDFATPFLSPSRTACGFRATGSFTRPSARAPEASSARTFHSLQPTVRYSETRYLEFVNVHVHQACRCFRGVVGGTGHIHKDPIKDMHCPCDCISAIDHSRRRARQTAPSCKTSLHDLPDKFQQHGSSARYEEGTP